MPSQARVAVLPEVRRWLARHSHAATEWTAEQLVAAKNGTRVSVVLPARNEQQTVGEIVGVIRCELMRRIPLVDELIVIDSRSTDATALVAAAAGATVVPQDDVLPELPPMAGKGDALWKSLAATSGDVLVFVDADLRNFGPHFITGLLGPLLTDQRTAYVKSYYDRPLVSGDGVAAPGGGRVTELVARPLINLFWPELAGFVQPLSGEYAGRREALEQVPFVSGYGVELGLLIDLVDLVDLDGFAQVDLGTRVHSHQSMEALGQMAGQILHTAWSRLKVQGRILASEEPSPWLTQFCRAGDGIAFTLSDVGVAERPPLISMGPYAERRRYRPLATRGGTA